MLVAAAGGAWAEGPVEALPDGLRGFSGRVRRVVGERHENTFAFRAARVLDVSKNNKAENPDAIAGLTILVGPNWRQDD
jgi:hypothetical protein